MHWLETLLLYRALSFRQHESRFSNGVAEIMTNNTILYGLKDFKYRTLTFINENVLELYMYLELRFLAMEFRVTSV